MVKMSRGSPEAESDPSAGRRHRTQEGMWQLQLMLIYRTVSATVSFSDSAAFTKSVSGVVKGAVTRMVGAPCLKA
jgi:hypothetical protein